MKKLLSLILCLAMVFSLAACGGKDKPEATTSPAAGETTDAATEAPATDDAADADGIQVGVVLPTKDEPRWIQDQAKFEEAISSSGYKTEVLFSQGSSATEKTNVETLIQKGIKVLIICAQDAAAAAGTVQEARDAGVKVIAYDRLITDTEAVDYYVTFDSLSVGKAQGQYLIDNAKAKGSSLYLYAGAATDNNAFLFFEGAWSVLQPKIADGTFVIRNSSEAEKVKDKATLTRDEMAKIIGQVTTNWDFNEAKSKAEAHLAAVDKAGKGDCFVLAPNDGTARSIADTFAADGDVTSYFVTGQDAEKASVQYVIDGKQSMTVFKDTRVLATDAMNMAVALIKGETPDASSSYNNGKIDVPSKQTDIVVVNKDNVKAALIDSGYYTAEDFTGLE